MNAFLLYIRSARMLVRCQAQYRASFLMQTFTQLMMMACELASVLLLLDRYGSIGQWSRGDILFFFGVMATTFYIVEAAGRGITSFSSLVRIGELDTILIRPRGVLFQILCSQVDPRRLGAIAVGVAALAAGSIRAQIKWSMLKGFVLLTSLAGGCFLVLGLFLIEATISLFSIKGIEAVNVLTYGGRSACQYPIDIYPRPLRILFTALAPFALTTHLPSSFILDKTLYNAPLSLVLLSPMSGVVFFILMCLIFHIGLRHYRSTGS